MKDKLNSPDIHSCPTCGAPCVVAGNLTRYFVPVKLSEVEKLAKHGDRKMREKIDRMLLNLAGFLANKNETKDLQ